MSPHTRISFRDYRATLGRYLRPQWPWVVALAVALLASIALQLANPQILRSFLDAAQAGAANQTLFRYAGLFLGLSLVQQVVAVAATYLGENVGWNATNALRLDVARHCLDLDLSFHNAHTPGEMIERIDGDVTSITEFFSQFVVQVVGNGLLLAGLLVLLWRIDWRVGAVQTAFAALTFAVLGRFRDIAVPHWKAERQASAELFGFLEERLSGAEDLRSNGGEAHALRGFYSLMRELLRRSLKAGLMVNVLLNSSIFLYALGTASAFALGAWLFEKQLVTIGTVYIVFYYTNMLERPIRHVTHQMELLQKAGAGLVRVRELLAVESKVRDPLHVQQLPSGALAVEFCDVSFGYADPQPTSASSCADGETGAEQALPAPSPEAAGADLVLRDVSFRLEPGRVLGLLGRTGSGKTTLTRLLLRLWDPMEGRVLLGDATGVSDLRSLALGQLRHRVGMVTQNIQLFHASIRDNLTFFDPTIPDEQVSRVIGELGLAPWLDSMPQGLHTMLESGGGGLSAGQAQLLAFARIFLRDPGLVILDEASSRLDPATEHLVERAVDRLLQGRTAIVIAHRLHTVQRADEILILEEGRIVEYGARTALLGDSGSRFAHLLRSGLEEVLA